MTPPHHDSPTDRAAAILAELDASPEVAVLVADGIVDLKIAQGWRDVDGRDRQRRVVHVCAEIGGGMFPPASSIQRDKPTLFLVMQTDGGAP